MRNAHRVELVLLVLSYLIYHGCTSKEEQQPQTQAHSTSSSQNGLSYTIPANWIEEKPLSTMRKAQFRLPGVDGAGDAELAVFVFPGGGGGIQANINRWIEQFKQPDGSNSMDKTDIKKIESNGLPVNIVYVTGTYNPATMGGSTTELKNYAMIAAIVETSTDPWFFKTVGPEETINHWRQDFEKFTHTFNQK